MHNIIFFQQLLLPLEVAKITARKYSPRTIRLLCTTSFRAAVTFVRSIMYRFYSSIEERKSYKRAGSATRNKKHTKAITVTKSKIQYKTHKIVY